MADLRMSLRDLAIASVEETGHEIGKGSYGVVNEYIIYGGLRCAGKLIHEELANAESAQNVSIMDKFEEECILLSKQRHPNIVLFMGVYFKEGALFPALLMELLPISLDGALEKYLNMPDYTKNVILYDVACGLSFLHSKQPPILHRDLSSRNVLLTESFHAKIADLGVARIAYDTVKKLTSIPGTPVFMPPEAFPDDAEYGKSLDMFSYGVVTLSTIIQRWPNPGNHLNKERVGVREVIRRKKDLDDMGEMHPLREFTESCLSDNGEDRPSAIDAVKKLQHEIKSTPRPFSNSMQMIQHNKSLSDELFEMTRNVTTLQDEKQEIERNSNATKSTNVRLELENTVLNEEITTTRKQRQEKDNMIRLKENVIEAVNTEKAALQERADNKVVLLEPSASLKWTKCSNLPHPRKHVQAVELKGKVYIGSGYGSTDNVNKEIYCYNPRNDEWEQSSQSLTCFFAMAVFDSKVLLMGGKEGKHFSTRVQVLSQDGRRFSDSEDVPAMLTARAGSVAASLTFYLVVAGGYSELRNRVKSVEVFDRRSRMWKKVSEIPRACAEMKSAIAYGDRWYLLGGSNQEKRVFTTSLLNLVERPTLRNVDVAENGGNSVEGEEVWTSLPDLSYDFSCASVFCGSLVALGGEKEKMFGAEFFSHVYVYNNYRCQWIHVAELPVALTKSCALVLGSGEMLVIGGRSNEGKELDVMYKCKAECPM